MGITTIGTQGDTVRPESEVYLWQRTRYTRTMETLSNLERRLLDGLVENGDISEYEERDGAVKLTFPSGVTVTFIANSDAVNSPFLEVETDFPCKNL